LAGNVYNANRLKWILVSSSGDQTAILDSNGTLHFGQNDGGSYRIRVESLDLPSCYDEKTVNLVKAEIEADLKDQAPAGKTYASEINPDSIVLKLNNTQVTPTITDISGGKHIYYKPDCSELNIPGNNTVEIKMRDNANAGVKEDQALNDAGNPTEPDPVTWTFTLP
jgi:hypothetical protein